MVDLAKHERIFLKFTKTKKNIETVTIRNIITVVSSYS